MIINVYTDGGARGNPGPAAIGVVIKTGSGSSTEKITSFGERIGIATNNVAEYKAVIGALAWINANLANKFKKGQIKEINFHLDSLLVASQINGLYRVKDSILRELLINIRNEEGAIGVPIRYLHIPRAENFDADFEVNKVLDATT